MYYDLLVIGNGPEGRTGAMTAAALNKRAALVDHPCRPGAPARVDTGADFSGIACRLLPCLLRHPGRDGCAHQDRDERTVPIRAVRRKLAATVRRDRTAARQQLIRKGVDWFSGSARFVGPHEVEVVGLDHRTTLEADAILIATGTRPVRPAHIPFDDTRLLTPENLVALLDRLPRSTIVVGAGSTGLDCAVLCGVLGMETTLVDRRDRLGHDAAGPSADRARTTGVVFRFGKEVIGAECLAQESVRLHLHGGENLMAEAALFCVGRAGNTDGLGLDAAGIKPDERGQLWCDDNLQTWTPHIYAAGGVIGFPFRSDRPEDQARRVVAHAFAEALRPSARTAVRERTVPAAHEIPGAV